MLILLGTVGGPRLGISFYCNALVFCLRNFIYQLRRISSDAGMPVIKDPFFQRYIQGVDNVEPLFRQLRAEKADLQLIMVILPGKTPVYGEWWCVCVWEGGGEGGGRGKVGVGGWGRGWEGEGGGWGRGRRVGRGGGRGRR